MWYYKKCSSNILEAAFGHFHFLVALSLIHCALPGKKLAAEHNYIGKAKCGDTMSAASANNLDADSNSIQKLREKLRLAEQRCLQAEQDARDADEDAKRSDIQFHIIIDLTYL